MVLFHLTGKRRCGGPCLEADGGRWGRGPRPSLWSGMFCVARTRADGRVLCPIWSLGNQEPPKDCSSWVSRKGQKEISEDDTRGCFLWENHQQWPGVAELAEGQHRGLGTYRLWPWGRVSRTSQPPPRQQGWEQVSVHKSSSHLAGHWPRGEPPRGATWRMEMGCAAPQMAVPGRTRTVPRCKAPFAWLLTIPPYSST